MKQKPLIAIMVVMLALGCTDELTADLDLSGTDLNCSEFNYKFSCSNRTAYLHEPIDFMCVSYMIHKCCADKLIFTNNTLYDVTVYGSHNCTHITPCEIESKFTFDCRDVAEDYWSYPQSYQPFNWAFEKCNETFPELIRTAIEKQEIRDSNIIIAENATLWVSNNTLINWSTMYIPTNYYFNNFSGNVTFYNTTCRFIPCGINTDCLECEEIGADTLHD